MKNSRDLEKKKGTTDGMFALREQVEKKLEGQKDMTIEFTDLEKV